ncbi:hypothetical protein ACHAWF_018183 [Thalassiosira exigua]
MTAIDQGRDADRTRLPRRRRVRTRARAAALPLLLFAGAAPPTAPRPVRGFQFQRRAARPSIRFSIASRRVRESRPRTEARGWIQGSDGEWTWEEDDPSSSGAVATASAASSLASSADDLDARATPSLPAGKFRPKQSLGQNYLRDGNTVSKIVRAFVDDATSTLGATGGGGDARRGGGRGGAVELGPGAGALTEVLFPDLGFANLQCVEIDERSVELLADKHPELRVRHEDVLQTSYPALAEEAGGPLSVIGNLPYYFTSQILFALADASHADAVRSATVTMQWEVAQRIVAPTRTKDYGILSAVFQLYADCDVHFKIPPTVFYPRPKVDSALVGLKFLGPTRLRRRLGGVDPADLRSVVTSTFRQRRKTVRNGLRKLASTVFGGDKDRELPADWAKKRPEELTPGQFVELTRMLYGPRDGTGWEERKLGTKVWRKMKHGSD